MRPILVLTACVSLAGCATPTPPPAPTAKRVIVSNEQEKAVRTVLAKSLKDIANPVFPYLEAAAEPDGATFFCGTAKPEQGNYQNTTPFAVMIRGSEATLVAFGGNARDNRAVDALCSSKGIDLVGLHGNPSPTDQGWFQRLL